MPCQYKKTAYELVKEATYNLGKDGKSFHNSDVINYIRTRYPDCPFKDNTIKAHLKGLSKNVESSKKHHPSLYKRAFLIYLGNGRFKLADDSEPVEVSSEDRVNPEEIAKEVMESHFGVKLEKRKVEYLWKIQRV